MSATKAAPKINRKQTRAEVDGQIQKSIPMYLQAAPWQCLEKTICSTKLEYIKTMKVGSSRAYQDYDQEQEEHLVQPGAMTSNILFVKYVPFEEKKARSLSDICMYVFSLFATIAMVILGKLCSNHSEDSQSLTGVMLRTIFNTPEKNRALLVKK